MSNGQAAAVDKRSGTVSTSEQEIGYNDEGSQPTPVSQVGGRRLRLLTLALCVALSQSTLETTIVSTSLVSVTDALGGFDQRDWVVTAYLLTYTSFLIIYARFSEVFGLKTMLLTAVAFFVVFSGACAAAQSMTTLIVLRAFQGIGGAGIVATVMVTMSKVVPKKKAAKYIAAISAVNMLSSILGPVLGGVINVRGQWRWIFLFNVPLGSVAFAMLACLMPSATSSRHPKAIWSNFRAKFTDASLARLDITGAGLLLSASVLLIFALEEGGTRYPWAHPVTISTICLSSFLFLLFVIWELRVERLSSTAGRTQPVFPVSLLKNRVLGGVMLTSFLTGFPIVTLTVNLPQRMQAVSDSSPLAAGLLLLPFLLTSALFTPISALLLTKARLPPFLILLAASLIQLVGVGLMCSLPTSDGPNGAQYAYEVLMGAAFGTLLTLLVLLTQYLVDDAADRAVLLAAVPQLRVFAGTIGLAVCAALLNNHVSGALAALGLEPQAIRAIEDSLANAAGLDAELQAKIRTVFAEGYRRQFVALTAFSAAILLATGMMACKKLLRHVTKEDLEDEDKNDDTAGKEKESGISTYEEKVVQAMEQKTTSEVV